MFGQLELVPIGEDEHVFFGQPMVHGQSGVGLEHPVLAVDGHEIAGLGEVDNAPQFFAAGVSLHVGHLLTIRDDASAQPDQVVDRLVYGHLIPGYRVRGDDDRVPLPHVHVPVFPA